MLFSFKEVKQFLCFCFVVCLFCGLVSFFTGIILLVSFVCVHVRVCVGWLAYFIGDIAVLQFVLRFLVLFSPRNCYDAISCFIEILTR